MTAVQPSDLTPIYERLSDVEVKVASILGAQNGMVSQLSDIKSLLETSAIKTGNTSLLQKALIGGIVVQALLHGLTTPEMARQVINQLLKGSP